MRELRIEVIHRCTETGDSGRGWADNSIFSLLLSENIHYSWPLPQTHQLTTTQLPNYYSRMLEKHLQRARESVDGQWATAVQSVACSLRRYRDLTWRRSRSIWGVHIRSLYNSCRGLHHQSLAANTINRASKASQASMLILATQNNVKERKCC